MNHFKIQKKIRNKFKIKKNEKETIPKNLQMIIQYQILQLAIMKLEVKV